MEEGETEREALRREKAALEEEVGRCRQRVSEAQEEGKRKVEAVKEEALKMVAKNEMKAKAGKVIRKEEMAVQTDGVRYEDKTVQTITIIEMEKPEIKLIESYAFTQETFKSLID